MGAAFLEGGFDTQQHRPGGGHRTCLNSNVRDSSCPATAGKAATDIPFDSSRRSNAMQQTDDIVSGWLSGSDSIDGMENPAGPLYIEGAVATEAALTDSRTSMNMLTGITSVSCRPGGCACC
jgi:hypothetical protein